MKKCIAIILAAVLLLSALCACASDTVPTQSAQTGTEETATHDETAALPTPTPEPAGELTVKYAGDGTPVRTTDNYRVFYEIFVGSFSDSNGDGIGDLRGIINRMDYLNDGDPTSGKSLGIEGIWLTPIFSSPSYHKYDVTDYYSVDSSFGTTEDLKELVDLCHTRGVKVILDLPINHTGSLNKWYGEFVRAHREGDVDNPAYERYSYYSAPDKAPAGRTFSQITGTTDYVECNFAGNMPELNFDSEEVYTLVYDVAKYYLDMGVDGFRFDAAKYVYFGDNAKSAAFWERYISDLKKINEDLYTVAEVWDGDGITDRYFPYLNCFNFTTAGTSGLIAESAKEGNVNVFTKYVQSYITKITSLREDAMYVPFIANHDTDRAAGYLPGLNGRAQMAANLYILCPGSPFIYYGEEIGLRGSRGGAPTDADRRLAMIWGDGDTIKDPEGSIYNKANKNADPVAEQIADETSLYTYYKTLIAIRQAHPEIARGKYTALSLPKKTGAFLSTYNGSTVCVIHNTSTDAVTIDMKSVTDVAFTKISAEIGIGDFETVTSFDGTTLVIPPQTSVILR